jgi:hypothetical protein
MRWNRETTLSTCLLLLVLAANAAALWPELTIGRVNLNDSVLHYPLIERVVQAVQHGENPLDCWSAEWALGFPVLRVYQPLAHLLVAGSWFALGKTVPLLTLFTVERFLCLMLLPLSFFAAARLIGLPRLTASAAAVLAPLVSTNALYGVEYGSFTWAGSGLFPQAVATHFLLLALGFGWIAVRTGRRVVVAGAMVALAMVAHLIYGYMAAISLLLVAVLPDAAVPRPARLRRVLAVGAVAFLLSAFQLVPLARDAGLIGHSRWEPAWKWDSFGAWQVLRWLFTGELLDHGRLPVLTLLALGGAALYWWRRTPVHAFLAAGAALWIAMLFGRPFWGPLLNVLGVSDDMHLHRVIGGAHVFLVLLAAVALAEGWRILGSRRAAIAAAATALLLYPALRERAATLDRNAVWGRQNLRAYEANGRDLDRAIAAARERGGRAYAGLGGGWGGSFKVGAVPVFASLSTAQVPTVGFLYHAMALAGDVMVSFDDRSPEQYRLWNIRTVIAPPDRIVGPPGLLQPRERFGEFQTYEAPGGGYFDLVDVPAAVKTNRRDFYDVNERWLHSGWPGKRAHLLLDREGNSPAGLRRLAPDAPLPDLAAASPPGAVVSEDRQGQVYGADCAASGPAYALFKMGWHPNWHAFVDGVRQPAVMLSPGYAGVRLAPGRHRVEFRYEPGPGKPLLALAGVLLTVLLARFGERIPAFARAVFSRRPFHPQWLPTAAGIAALAAPVFVPLLTAGVPAGHDWQEYFPRVIEAHRNVENGIALFRWAPDLGHGYGQPLFLFRPPLFYWISELWHLAGWDAVTAVNLAAALLVLAAAAAAYRLGRLYYGPTGGWLAATAYLYAPYFAVDLYVRSALEEFAAFPLFALALCGFGAYARTRRRRDWLLGAAGQAGLLCCHFPAALLFTPLLAAWIGFTARIARSWRVAGAQAAAFAAALGLSAWSWLPAIAEKADVAMNRLVQGSLQYVNHFVYPAQLFDWKWGYGQSVPGPNDGMSFSLGWSHVLVAAAACAWIAWRPKAGDRRLTQFFSTAALLLCVLMLEDARVLWDHAPLLPFVEFPWRLLGPAALCVAMLAAGLAPAIDSLRRWRGPAFAGILALLAIPNLAHLAPPRIAEIDLALWTPAQMAAGGFESTTKGEVTPRWMETIPPYNSRVGVTPGADWRDVSRTPFSYTGEVTAQNPSRILMPLAWFPGWTVRLDGRTVEAGPAPGTGLIEFGVPPGSHSVQVAFGRSAARWWGEGISLLSLVGIACFALRRRAERYGAAAASAAADRGLSLPA